MWPSSSNSALIFRGSTWFLFGLCFLLGGCAAVDSSGGDGDNHRPFDITEEAEILDVSESEDIRYWRAVDGEEVTHSDLGEFEKLRQYRDTGFHATFERYVFLIRFRTHVSDGRDQNWASIRQEILANGRVWISFGGPFARDTKHFFELTREDLEGSSLRQWTLREWTFVFGRDVLLIGIKRKPIRHGEEFAGPERFRNYTDLSLAPQPQISGGGWDSRVVSERLPVEVREERGTLVFQHEAMLNPRGTVLLDIDQESHVDGFKQLGGLTRWGQSFLSICIL